MYKFIWWNKNLFWKNYFTFICYIYKNAKHFYYIFLKSSRWFGPWVPVIMYVCMESIHDVWVEKQNLNKILNLYLKNLKIWIFDTQKGRELQGCAKSNRNRKIELNRINSVPNFSWFRFVRFFGLDQIRFWFGSSSVHKLISVRFGPGKKF